MTGAAVIDASGRYRYVLRRRWSNLGPSILWVMLNPSTADADHDDPTIRRCRRFSMDWGYGALTVVNLFALRATDPRALLLPPKFYQSEHVAVVGPENDDAILQECAVASFIVAAWGNRGALYGRDEEVRELIGSGRLHHLGLTKMGQPRHPLYVPAHAPAMPWREP